MVERRPHLLLVDDDEGTRILYASLLEQAGGWRVTTAASGQEALTRAREEPPAVILLDLHMPVMNGLDVYREVRSLELPSRVIFFTGYGPDKVEAHARVNDNIRIFDHPAATDDVERLVARCGPALYVTSDLNLLQRIATTGRDLGLDVQQTQNPGDALVLWDGQGLVCLQAELAHDRLVALSEIPPGVLVALIHCGFAQGLAEPGYHQKSPNVMSVLETLAGLSP